MKGTNTFGVYTRLFKVYSFSIFFGVGAKGGGRRFEMGAKPQGVWGTGVSQRGTGAEPRYGVCGRSPQKLKNF